MPPGVRWATLAAAVAAAGCAGPSPGPTPAVTPATAPAGLSIDSHERYYDIRGSSTQQLRDAMRRRGPTDHDERRDALTVWELEWTYREGRTVDGCALRNVRVTLAVTVTLPRWTPPAGASDRLVESWSRFLERVKVHEAGHRAIAEQNARELVAALSSLRGASCRQVWDDASHTAARIVAAGRAKNHAYDVETNHGQTQGVVLTP